MAKKKYYETEKFKRTQAEWYKKLAQTKTVEYPDGFQDIDPGDEIMIQPQVFVHETVKRQYIGGLNYYQYCQYILEKHVFDQDFAPTIKHLFNLGESLVGIQRQLEQKSFITFDVRRIKKIALGESRDFDRTIFELHTEGKARREIQVILLEKHQFKMDDVNIQRIINKIKTKFRQV